MTAVYAGFVGFAHVSGILSDSLAGAKLDNLSWLLGRLQLWASGAISS